MELKHDKLKRGILLFSSDVEENDTIKMSIFEDQNGPLKSI